MTQVAQTPSGRANEAPIVRESGERVDLERSVSVSVSVSGDDMAEFEASDDDEDDDEQRDELEWALDDDHLPPTSSRGSPAQVGSLKRLAYVETSLDNLSYSSASSRDSAEADTNQLGQEAGASSQATLETDTNLTAPQTKPDQAASGQSADEEEERRLLAQLQSQQQHRHRLAQQQQQQQHQQQQEQLQRQAQAQAQRYQQQQQLSSEDEAPQVPVRRSSQHQLESAPAPWRQTVPARRPQHAGQYTLVQLAGSRAAERFDPSELPRPLVGVAEAQWRARLGKRPSQPPPPPPLAPALRHLGGNEADFDDDLDEEEVALALLNAPPINASRRIQVRSGAPKNIWSPESSSLASSSCEPDSSSAARLAPPVACGGGSAGTTSTSTTSGAQRTFAEMSRASSTSGQNTIVERQTVLADEHNAQALVAPPEAATRAEPSANERLAPLDSNSDSDSDKASQRAPGEALRDDNATPTITQHQQSAQSETTPASELGAAVDFVGEPEPPLDAFVVQGDGVSQAAGWRSFSVSLHGGQQELKRIQAAKLEANGADSNSGRRPNYLRSFSIATSTLPASSTKADSIVGRQQVSPNSAEERQQERGADRKQWNTLPGKHSATASNTFGENNSSDNNSEMLSPLSAGHFRQQQAPIYKQTVLRETHTTSSRYEQSLELANSGNEPELEEELLQIECLSGPSGQQTASSSDRQRRARESADLGQQQQCSFSADKKNLNYHQQARFACQAGNDLTDVDREGGRNFQAADEHIYNNNMLRDNIHSFEQINSSNTQHHQHQQPQQQQQDQKPSQNNKDNEWYRQMYRQMQNSSKQTPEKSLMQAVNSQPESSQIRIKLKSPKSDHRCSPSYYSEEDFELRRDKNSVSPTFKPGTISNYVPGQSSISQHERNLNLYYQLIDHIDRVFSSVLFETTSRSTNTLQAIKHHSIRRKNRQIAQSRSGPQTPVTSCARRSEFYREQQPGLASKTGRATHKTTDTVESEHDKRCVFSNLLKNHQHDEVLIRNDDAQVELSSDPRKQYVAVQQGHDIPLKGLRKSAPQPNIYKDQHLFSDESINIHYRAPTSRLLKMNTFNEFELNRIKKLYQDELESRLQRSKSTRLAARHLRQSEEAVAGGEPLKSAGLYERQRASRSAERFGPTRPESAFVDLNRYQHAFLSKAAGMSSLSGRKQQQRRQRCVIRFGRALFDFQAKNEREISLRRGDLVELLELIDHSWARVEDCQSGLHGLVPLNYIDYSVGCAVAKRDVTGGHRGSVHAGHAHATLGPPTGNSLAGQLLPMSKGEPITLLRRLRGHWYEASNTRQAMGLVWSADLEIIKQPVLGEPQRPGAGAAAAAATGEPDAMRPSSGISDEFTDDDDDEEEDIHVEPTDCADLRHLNVTARGYLDEEDDDEEEEMFILASGDQQRIALARRRARSESGMPRPTSGSSSSLAAAASGCCAQVAPTCAGLRPCDEHRYRANWQHSAQSTSGPPPANLYAQTDCPCCPAQHQHQSGLPRRSSSSPYISAMLTGDERAKPPAAVAGRNKQALPRLFRARYAYKPRQKDELELVPGDVLMVVHQCDDGWFIGTSYSTKEMGTFPGNFVELIN